MRRAASVIVGLWLLNILLLTACGQSQPDLDATSIKAVRDARTAHAPTKTPTAIPTPTPTATPKPCGPYIWADGTVSPGFISQVQAAMTAAGIQGSVKANTFGENNGECGYGAQAVDYTFTVQVASLEVSADLASVASSILDIARRFVGPGSAPNLGNLQLIFQTEAQNCEWIYRDDAWNWARSSTSIGVNCPVPTSPESQRLAEMLTALSGDLVCGTSTVTGNLVQAVLECERPEGKNRFLLTVKLRLNGQGRGWTCFHGYKAFESNITGDTPMTVTEYGKEDVTSYFERDRTFEWTANGIVFALSESIKGGPDVTLPPVTHEKVFARAMQAGLIPGEGNSCP